MIDQIFDQLDEENNGYISSIKLLSIIKSLEDSSELMDHLGTECSVFSSSPPICPEYQGQQNQGFLITNLHTNLFSTVDPQNTGYHH